MRPGQGHPPRTSWVLPGLSEADSAGLWREPREASAWASSMKRVTHSSASHTVTLSVTSPVGKEEYVYRAGLGEQGWVAEGALRVAGTPCQSKQAMTVGLQQGCESQSGWGGLMQEDGAVILARQALNSGGKGAA